MLKNIWRYYNHPYRRRLLPVSVGVGVYVYLLIQRYHPCTVCAEIFHAHTIQDFVNGVAKILTDPSLRAFVLLSLLFLGAISLWLFFFAQFTLPVHGWRERWGVFTRLFYYIIGTHGPALFVQDGHVIENKGERRREGPGVIVLDTTSAAVLKNAANFTRAVGPGVVFTNSGETIPKGAALDLRKRSASIGPNPGEDPFAPPGADEKPEAYRERQGRRWETSAKTQDGTEVVARLLVVFSLDPHPDGLSEETYQRHKFRTAFKGHGVSAWRAIVHRPVASGKQYEGNLSQRLLAWHWLPARLAASLWQEYLQLFKLSDLFRDLQDNRSALDIINAAIKERLTSPFYQEIGRDGQFTGRRLPSQEYALLQKRGIRVITFLTTEVFLPPAVEQGLIERWVANWKMRAEKERQVVEHKRIAAQKSGEEQAATLWGAIVEQTCRSVPASRTATAACLERLLYALTQAVQADPALYQAQRAEFHNLQMLWAWAHDTAEARQRAGEDET